MADTGSPYSLPYQVLGDRPDGPDLGFALAAAVHAQLARVDSDIADTGDAITAVIARMLSMTSAAVATNQSTAGAAYGDLATVGPQVTRTSTGTLAVVLWTANTWCDVATAGGAVSFEVSGATTLVAADTHSLKSGGLSPASGFGSRYAQVKLVTVNPGANTYTLKYKAVGGTAVFQDRELLVWAP